MPRTKTKQSSGEATADRVRIATGNIRSQCKKSLVYKKSLNHGSKGTIKALAQRCKQPAADHIFGLIKDSPVKKGRVQYSAPLTKKDYKRITEESLVHTFYHTGGMLYPDWPLKIVWNSNTESIKVTGKYSIYSKRDTPPGYMDPSDSE
eukprot:TRINITY_DN80842_c0_g1_i1.p1 TRINITY_DN80842_c0_g1~~TRINITY_DN80842_c0_g1_i1.p1  ORF type:complete len:149 (-),score=10.83 TRINITY_DN80842_c0_g1_i1:389-835(-)